MSFWDSKIFNDALTLVILLWFALMFYALYRKITPGEAWQSIKEWYNNLDKEDEE